METTWVDGQAKEGGEGPGARELKKGSFFHLTFEGSGGAKRVEGEEELVWV